MNAEWLGLSTVSIRSIPSIRATAFRLLTSVFCILSSVFCLLDSVVQEKRYSVGANSLNGLTLQHLPEDRRLAVEQVWRAFSNVGGLAGLFITGSVARGLDGPDDLDIIAIWDRPLTDRQRQELVTRCRGRRVGDPDTDRFDLHGVVPEFHFMAGKDQVRQMISGFCWRSELPPESDADRVEGMLASLVDAVPVYDPEALVHQWQKMLSDDYPQQYQVKRVHEQYAAACRRLAHLHRCGWRYDLFYWMQSRLVYTEHIVKALVSLNRRFYWGQKWIQQQVERLPLKPENTWPRICTVLSTEADASVLEMTSLALSVGKIIGATLPGVDVEFSLKIIRNLKK